MGLHVTQQNTDAAQTPLECLSTLLCDDMKAVNKSIIDNMQSDVPIIPQLAGYLIASGGKRIRPLLTLACTRIFDTKTDRPFGLAASVEFIHTATLLHDDVVDGSDERRGQKAANLVFGNQASVLVGDFLFSRAFQLMTADGSLDVLRILSDASAIIAQGEVKQLTTANNLDTSMDDYLEVISAKTAALFAAACEIGPVIAGQAKATQTAMAEYGMALGIAFQIIDDVLDYNAEQKRLGKATGDDFREGKMTAPVLLALENANDQERAFWTRTMGELKQEDGDFERAVEIMAVHDSLDKGVKLAEDYAAKAIAALDTLPADSRESDLGFALKDLIQFVITRAY